MKHQTRNKVTGQFCKKSFSLYLHDFGNLSCQLISVSENEHDLNRIADRMNYLFEQSGHSKQFKAEIYQVKQEVSHERS